MAPFISVVIPGFNEEKRLPLTIERMINFNASYGYSLEVMIVDDGSTDSTAALSMKYANNHNFIKYLRAGNENKGKGFAVKTGVMAASGDYILICDADMSTPIEEVDKLIKWIDEGFDLVIGSRALNGSEIKVAQPWYRTYMGKIFNRIVRSLVIDGIKDTQCGFKLIKKDVAKQLFNKISLYGFSFDVELLFIAKKVGFKIKEVPIVWENDPESKVRMFADSLVMVFDLIKIRINELRGCY